MRENNVPLSVVLRVLKRIEERCEDNSITVVEFKEELERELGREVSFEEAMEVFHQTLIKGYFIPETLIRETILRMREGGRCGER